MGNTYEHVHTHTQDFLLGTTLWQELAYQAPETWFYDSIYDEKEPELLEM